MGKTTLWRAGVEAAEAAGLCVLQAQPAESETALSFSGLGDLLDPVLDEALEPLPAGQRSALARALVLEEVEGPAPDAHAAGVALLNALRGLASTRDAPRRSRRRAVARRGVLRGARVRRASTQSRARRCPARTSLGPRERAPGRAEAHPALQRPGRRPARSRGVAPGRAGPPRCRAASTAPGGGASGLGRKPLLRARDRAHAHAQRRVRRGRKAAARSRLPPRPRPRSSARPAAREPRLPGRRRCACAPDRSRSPRRHPVSDASWASSPALEARIVETEGDRIRFTHPLLAAGALETADPQRRAEIHARLAELLEDPEARAWQLAASVDRARRGSRGGARGGRASTRARAVRHGLRRFYSSVPSSSRRTIDRTKQCGGLSTPPTCTSRRATRDAAEAKLRDLIAPLSPGPQRASALVRTRTHPPLRGARGGARAVRSRSSTRPATIARRSQLAHEGVAACSIWMFERFDDAVRAHGHRIRTGRRARRRGTRRGRAPDTARRGDAARAGRPPRRPLERALALQDVRGGPSCPGSAAHLHLPSAGPGPTRSNVRAPRSST